MSTTVTAASSGPGPEPRSVLSPELLPITLSTLTAISLAAFDGLGVTAAQSRIAGDLGHVDLLPWVFTAFSLTLTIAALAAGPLIDGLGLRRTYRATLVLFLGASTVCALAPNMPLLIAARAVQGIGGGLIVAIALSAIGLTYPAHLRSRGFAANSTVWGVMSFGGPAVAAVLLHTPIGWRAIFAVNIPLTAFAMVIGWSRFPGPAAGAKLRFDGRGLVLIGAMTTLLLVGVAELNRWSFPALILAVVFGSAAWRHMGRVDDPVFARTFLTRQPIAGINLAVLTLFTGSIAVEAFIPLFVRGGLGRSETAGAFSVMFLSLGWTCASIVVSRLLDRRGEANVMMAGFVMAIPPLVVAFATYSASTPLAIVIGVSFVEGMSIGTVTNSALTLLQKRAPPDEMGRTNAAHQFVRNLGSTIGVAAAGGILFGVVTHRIGDLEEIRPLLKGEKTEFVRDEARAAIAAGYRWAHALSIALAIIGLLLVSRMRSSIRRADAAGGDSGR